MLPPRQSLTFRYDEMCRAIAAAYQADEVKHIRDKALAIETYAAQAKNIEAERQACEIRLRAERKAGQLLNEREMAKAGRPSENPSQPVSNLRGAETLAGLGISHNQSSRWQKLAAIPEADFEATFARPEKPSTSGIIAASKSRGASPAPGGASRGAVDLEPMSH